MPSGAISHTAGPTFEDLGLTFYDPEGVGQVRENVENVELAHALKGTWDSQTERVDVELNDDPKLNLRNHLNVPGDVETDSLKPDDNSDYIGLNSNRLQNLKDGSNAQDAATVSQLVDASGDSTSQDNVPEFEFRVSGDGSLTTTWDSNNQKYIVDYYYNDTVGSDDPFDLYVNGGFIESNVEDMDFTEGNAIDLVGYDRAGSDAELNIAVDESDIDHNNLLNSADSDAHHTRPSAGSGLSESSGSFDINAGAGLGISADTLSVDDPLNLAELEVTDEIRVDRISYQSSGGQIGDGVQILDTNDDFGRLGVKDLDVLKIRALPQNDNVSILAYDGTASRLMGPDSFESTTGPIMEASASDTYSFKQIGGDSLRLSNVGAIDGPEPGGATILPDGKGSAWLTANGVDFFSDNLPYGAFLIDGSGTLQEEEGNSVVKTSGTTASGGSFSIELSPSATHASVTVQKQADSDAEGWMTHWWFESGFLEIRTVRIQYDSSGSVTDVSRAAPDGISVTVWT